MKHLLQILLILILVAGSTDSRPSNKKILLRVISPELAWNDSRVAQKLRIILSRKSDIRVTLIENKSAEGLLFPEDYYNYDSLFNWGQETGGRILMLVDIFSERLERRKSFHLPLVFHKYETMGIIEGELRIVDLLKGKIITAEPFKVEQKGPRIFQATMDDDINDPDLHLTAPDKIQFFDKLEDKLCQHLTRRIKILVSRI